MTKASKKLLVSIAVLVLTIALATTSTFAWFTMNTNVTIGDIEADVTTNTGGLYISLDGTTFSTKLTTEQIYKMIYGSKDADTEATANGWGEIEMDALTTVPEPAAADKVTVKPTAPTVADPQNPTEAELLAIESYNVELNKYNITKAWEQGGLMKEDGTLVGFNKDFTTVVRPGTPVNPDDASQGTQPVVRVVNNYIEYDLFFRATAEMTVALSSDFSSVTSTRTEKAAQDKVYAWDDFADTVYGQALTKGEEIIAHAQNAARVSFFDTDVTANGKGNNIWHPNNATDSDTAFNIGNLARDFRNQLLGTNDTYTEKTGQNLANITDIVKLTKAADGAFYEGKITVRIWLEGTDGDCFNAVLSDLLKVKLGFTGTLVTQP